MGCIASKIDREERVRICKERKALMKQLLGYRGKFADAQLSYLRALKNTGVTLRQLTESDMLEIENTVLPRSPPPPLPPSPPPPPSFSPDLRKSENIEKDKNDPEEIIEIDDDNSLMPLPPPIPSTNWDFWDPFALYSPERVNKNEIVEPNEEENWAEAKSEFDEDVEGDMVNLLSEKEKGVEFLDDASSMVSWHTKDTADMAVVVWNSKRTLGVVVKELDEYFLKASEGGKSIVIMVDVSSSESLRWQNSEDSRRRSSNSAKVFNALSWSWSSRSLQCTRNAADFYSPTEPCRAGAHCITLEKLYAQEQRLYKEIKDEEITKLEHEKKSLLLLKQKDEDHDPMKTEKTQLNVESLQSNIIRLKESICRTCSSLSNLIEEELHPQIIAIITGLTSMWGTVYECHQVQNHISRQLSHLINHQNVGPTTEYHRQAAAQLKTEVTSWYSSFCRLVKGQGDYVRALRRWVQLSDLFLEEAQRSGGSSTVVNLCEKWELALEKLPDKVASEAIKSFLAAVHSIVLQQQEELNLHRKSDKLQRKLQRELNSLAEMEIKLEGNLCTVEDTKSNSSSKHPLFVKRTKIEALKKQANDQKAKYLNSVQVTRAMTMSNLRTSLPNVFEALMVFSRAYTQALEAVLSVATQEECDGSSSPVC